MSKKNANADLFNNLFSEDPNTEDLNALKKDFQESKYHITIYLPNNSSRIFENCSYLNLGGGFNITTAAGETITFIGNYCAEIVKMEDFNKILK